MNSNTEKRIRKIEDEIEALKTAFAREATNLIIFTKEKNFSTSKNEITATQAGYDPVTYLSDERVVVTFDTQNGANTPAVLELTSDNDYATGAYGRLVIQRIPYNGGARWIVEAPPSNQSSWRTTNYRFVVHSLINGSLGAKMIWQ